MFGRLRTFRHLGGEIRTEWANRNVLGFNQDIQAGIRYEYQDMTNRNFLGLDGQILGEGDSSGATLFDRSLSANTVSAFLQTNIAVAKNFNVLPGIRFEWYDISRTNRVIAEEESEAGEEDPCPVAPFAPDECLEIEGINFNPDRHKESYSNFNALPGIAFAYTGLYRSTLYGGYHRGMSTGVLRNDDFPASDEIGDNFNLGFRSPAIKGFDYEVAGFYQLIEDYQFGSSFSDAGDRSYGRAKEVEISGVELYGRLNSKPFTGGPLNFFTEGNYTYARGVFTDAPELDENGDVVGSFNGNHLPEVPFHVAALTVGVEGTTGWRWNASTTWTYRGSFFTDESNLANGAYPVEECDGDPVAGYECEIEEAGEDGQVPSVWILSARFNLDLGNTGASVFVAGDNLLNEFYISDREDGMKPGMARTIWTGFKYKF
jgi:Fe(3+) dicitrate transport protein